MHYSPLAVKLFPMLLKFFSTTFNFLMLFVLLINIQQRRYTHAPRKRMSTLFFAAWYLIAFTLMIIRDSLHGPKWIDWISFGVCLVALVLLRKRIFPFRRYCEKCGAKLSFDEWIGIDDNLCMDCFYERYPEEKPKEVEKPRTEEEIQDDYRNAMKVDEIDWDRWDPKERCVLAYVTDEENDRILMIEKLRGRGTGYLNGPGGHIELEETAREATVREIKEETGLDVEMDALEERGVLHFQFRNGDSMIGYVFFTSQFSGNLIDRTDETIPFWCDRDKVDFSRMWEDDRIWLEPALNGHTFEGYFIFDDRTLLDHKVIFDEREKH